MNIKELIDLEIERRSNLITYTMMGRGDAYIEIELRALGESLYEKALAMKPVINNLLADMSEEDKTTFYAATDRMKEYMLENGCYSDWRAETR